MTVTDFRGAEAGALTDLQGSGGTVVSNETGTVYSGVYSYRMNPTTTAVGWVSIGDIGSTGLPGTVSLATIYFSGRFRYATKAASTSEEIFTVRQGANDRFVIRLNSTGNLEFYDTTNFTTNTPLYTGGTTLSSGTWYRISGSIAIGAGTGSASIYIDGVAEYLAIGTINTGATNFTIAAFGKRTNRNGQSVDYYYDDLIVDDSVIPDAWRIQRLAPTANGSTMQWSAGTGSSNYLEVDEIPVSTADYVATSSTAGDQALFTFAALSTIGASGSSNYRAVRIGIYTNEPIAVTSSDFVRMRSASTNADKGVRNLPTTNDYSCIIQVTNPSGGVAWTESAVDAVEGGAVENNAVLVRLNAAYKEILYSEPVAATTRKRLALLGVA